MISNVRSVKCASNLLVNPQKLIISRSGKEIEAVLKLKSTESDREIHRIEWLISNNNDGCRRSANRVMILIRGELELVVDRTSQVK